MPEAQSKWLMCHKRGCLQRYRSRRSKKHISLSVGTQSGGANVEDSWPSLSQNWRLNIPSNEWKPFVQAKKTMWECGLSVAVKLPADSFALVLPPASRFLPTQTLESSIATTNKWVLVAHARDLASFLFFSLVAMSPVHCQEPRLWS